VLTEKLINGGLPVSWPISY